MTPLVGLIVGIVALIACRLCYAWGFRDGKREPQKYLGFGIVTDERMRRDEIGFVDDRGQLLAKLTNIHWHKRLDDYLRPESVSGIAKPQ